MSTLMVWGRYATIVKHLSFVLAAMCSASQVISYCLTFKPIVMNTNVQRILDLYKNVETKNASILPAGEHRVKLVKATVTASNLNFDGSESTKTKPWADPNVQLLIQATNASGSCVIRKPLVGYVQKRDGIVAGAKQNFFSSVDANGKSFGEDYLCDIADDGTVTRVISEERTAKCMENISALASTFGKGIALDVIQEAAASGMEATVVLKEKDGRVDFSHFRKSMPAAVLTAEQL